MIDLINQAFEGVRDIEWSWEQKKSEVQFSINNCTSKAKILRNKLKKLNIVSRLVCTNFYWEDVIKNIKVPINKSLLQKAKKIPIAQHTFLSVNINGQEIYADPCWDIKLRGLLPVNDFLLPNFKHSIAVPFCSDIIEYSPREISVTSKINRLAVYKNDFFSDFNELLIAFRKGLQDDSFL
jgi:hypothetical protein